MKLFRLHSEVLIQEVLERVFLFFSNAGNLQEITPPWLSFDVLTPSAIEMKIGQNIDYRLKVRGLPLRWRSEITVWDPPFRFVDEQIRGPYKVWRHEHTFTERDGGTLCTDSVSYAVMGGSLVNQLLVEPDLKRIFAYRRSRLAEIFQSADNAISDTSER